MSENTQVVNEEVTNPQPSEGEKEVEKQEDSQQPAPGSKTDSELLLKSLQEEREKRRELEAKQKELEEQLTSTPSEYYTDEGQALQKEIASLKQDLMSMKEERELESVFTQHPVLKDKVDEFNEFKSSYPGVSADKLAKLFISENELADTPKRKGLEKSTGGQKTPSPAGMTTEEVTNLRKNNWKKYIEMLQKGQIPDLK